jgi:hypothetical protein
MTILQELRAIIFLKDVLSKFKTTGTYKNPRVILTT